MLEDENQKNKQELGVAENLLTLNDQTCLFNIAKEVQNYLIKTKTIRSKKSVQQSSPIFSFLAESSADITELREFKARCKNNRKRNVRFEANFRKTKKRLINEKKKIGTRKSIH